MSRYTSNYLSNVILKINFPNILELNKDHPPVKFQSVLEGRFPISKPIHGKYIEFKVDKDEPARISEVEITKWHFYDREKNKVIEVSPEWITIEFFKYKGFVDFSECFCWVLERFFKIYDVVRILNRIGLRYINQIKLEKGNPFEWEKLINSELVIVGKELIKQKQDIKKSMHVIESKGEGYDMKFQFGMFNSEYPNPIARKEFVLDYDCFLKEEIEIGEINTKVDLFKKVITSWFENSIEDGLRTIMGKVEDE